MTGVRTLYDTAAANLRTAQVLYDQVGDDECQLNIIGFHLQQAVEIALKYLLEQNGIEYPKTHDIDQLIRIGNEAGADLYVTEYVEDHAEMLSQWEAKSRYVIDYAIEARKIKRALDEIDKYLAEVAAQETAVIEASEQ